MSDSLLDFSGLSDDQVVTLARAVAAEFRRRGGACQVAAEAAVLDEAEKARIAMEAATREARRLAEEEARRVATEAAEKVRRESEAKAKADGAAQTADLWSKKEEIGREMAAVLGTRYGWHMEQWEKGTDKRLYIRWAGAEFGNNAVSYFHTGNQKVKPGTIAVAEWILGRIADREGISDDEATARVLAFCKQISAKWNNLTLDTEADPEGPKVKRYSIHDGKDLTYSWLKEAGNGNPDTCERAGRKLFRTRAAAEGWLAAKASKFTAYQFKDKTYVVAEEEV